MNRDEHKHKEQLALYPELVKSLNHANFLLNSSRYFMPEGSLSERNAAKNVLKFQELINRAHDVEKRHG